MTEVSSPLAPGARDELADAIGRWLPAQRWFAGKARTIHSVALADALAVGEGEGRVLLAIVEVTYTDGPSERYQVPLAESADAALDHRVTESLADATAVPAACHTLLRLALQEAEHRTDTGAVVRGAPTIDAGDLVTEAPRRMTAEQSNTSVVFGDALILKVFRRLEAGRNPDVEITGALTLADFGHVPAQHGTAELVAPDGAVWSLSVVSEFAGGAEEGWALATREMREVSAGTGRGATLVDSVAELGAAVGGMHRALAQSFGVRAAGPDDARTWSEDMLAQADRVLALARERSPEACAPVLERVDDLRGRLERVASLRDPGPVCRTHGDLHLGQVLRAPDGHWLLLDFEGEPARPLEERTKPQPPLRDVAGMLRSFDYAAAQGASAGGGGRSPEVDALHGQLRRRFLEGYRAAVADAGVLPDDHSTVQALIDAFELDKAVYELGYELANRPDWVAIPVAGILRVLDVQTAAAAGTTPGDDVQDTPGPPPVDDVGGPVARTTTTGWRAAPDEVAALVAGVHRDPHRVLGAHEADGGGVVRVLRPEAERVEVLVDGADPVEAERTHDAGLFEALLPDRPAASSYRLRVHYPGELSFELWDPYAFWPTLGEVDLHLAGEGRHEELWRRMGAHEVEVEGVAGVAFAVWAPNARSVRVVGDFNGWDGRLHMLRMLGASGIWELFVPDAHAGAYYRYELVTADGRVVSRADPWAQATDVPPATASRVYRSTYEWGDQEWLEQRRGYDALHAPMSIYEVHLGSWQHADGEPLSYRELAHRLGEHCERLGFTHVELLPVAEHPFGGSWGYQVTGYFAPTSRFGDPDDFRYMVDHLHARGIGVIVDWVPAHFPKDEWALARFDGTALYEHLDPRRGEHPDWGTLVFNFSRNEVRNFLIANALYWIEELHVDGLRVDAVASMLYLDYSRGEGQWIPNEFGGRENLEAVSFLKELNAVVYGRNPGVVMIAEESTAWPGVSRPAHLGGLGFGFKWNMGWMHDTLSYFSRDPVFRRYHHHELTFGLVYAWSENYVLPLSHDEVVHGKRSLIDKMPGDRWQKHANLRALYAWMWAHPGKQLLFMGGEFGQWREWSESRELDWWLLDEPDHAGLMALVGDLNHVYRSHPALWQRDADPGGFRWIDASDPDQNVLSFLRFGREGEPPVACLVNLSSVVRSGLRVGLPDAGEWVEILNTDAEVYGGTNVGNFGRVVATEEPWHGLPASAEVTLPPLAGVWFTLRRPAGTDAGAPSIPGTTGTTGTTGTGGGPEADVDAAPHFPDPAPTTSEDADLGAPWDLRPDGSPDEA